MGRTTNGLPFPDELSPYPSRLWWKALAEAIDPWVGKLAALPDKVGLSDLLNRKIDKPEGPRTGQVLTYNGETWIAWDSAGGGEGPGGTGGYVLPISQRGAFLIGTGTGWEVMPGGKGDGQTLIVDPTNAQGYRWDSPLPKPEKGSLIVSTPDGWIPLTPSVKDGQALVSDSNSPGGVKWGTELPNPARGSVMVADGTRWLAAPWSGRDGEALIVDQSVSAGVKWGGVLPTPLRGALLIGDGLAWRLVTPPVSGNSVLMSDPGATNGLSWNNNYVRYGDLQPYVQRTELDAYVKASAIDDIVAGAVARRWRGWLNCKMASGWNGGIQANHDGTMIALRGTAYPSGSGTGNTVCYLPAGFPSAYAVGYGTHIRVPLKIDGKDYDIGGVRPSVITFSGSSVSTHGTIATMDRSYGTKLDGCIAVIA